MEKTFDNAKEFTLHELLDLVEKVYKEVESVMTNYEDESRYDFTNSTCDSDVDYLTPSPLEPEAKTEFAEEANEEEEKNIIGKILIRFFLDDEVTTKHCFYTKDYSIIPRMNEQVWLCDKPYIVDGVSHCFDDEENKRVDYMVDIHCTTISLDEAF